MSSVEPSANIEDENQGVPHGLTATREVQLAVLISKKVKTYSSFFLPACNCVMTYAIYTERLFQKLKIPKPYMSEFPIVFLYIVIPSDSEDDEDEIHGEVLRVAHTGKTIGKAKLNRKLRALGHDNLF